MNDIASIALGGLNASTARFEASAKRVATEPNADLISEVIQQKLAENAFKANLVVLKTANQMAKSVLDILA